MQLSSHRTHIIIVCHARGQRSHVAYMCARVIDTIHLTEVCVVKVASQDCNDLATFDSMLGKFKSLLKERARGCRNLTMKRIMRIQLHIHAKYMCDMCAPISFTRGTRPSCQARQSGRATTLRHVPVIEMMKTFNLSESCHSTPNYQNHVLNP